MKQTKISEKTKLSFNQLEKALQRLKQMLDRPADADRANVDASIQRFEFCIELSWKALKRLLFDLGKEVNFPKEILQEAFQGHLIDDEISWILMLTDRNQTSHTYDEELADQIFNRLPGHLQVMQETYQKLSKSYVI